MKKRNIYYTQTLPVLQYVLFSADFAGYTVYDVVGFAGTAPNGVVTTPCDRASDATWSVKFETISAIGSNAFIGEMLGWSADHI